MKDFSKKEKRSILKTVLKRHYKRHFERILSNFAKFVIMLVIFCLIANLGIIIIIGAYIVYFIFYHVSKEVNTIREEFAKELKANL